MTFFSYFVECISVHFTQGECLCSLLTYLNLPMQQKKRVIDFLKNAKPERKSTAFSASDSWDFLKVYMSMIRVATADMRTTTTLVAKSVAHATNLHHKSATTPPKAVVFLLFLMRVSMSTMQIKKPTKKDQQKKDQKKAAHDQGAGPYHAKFMRGINGSDSILETPFPQIAFVGRSNVGKSSSINALLGVAGLARTSATPGKTQEINFFMINENTFFVDLPGYGFANMPEKEREQIRKHILWYLSGGEAHPKLLILIVDARHGVTEHDRELIDIAQSEGHPLLLLLNKIDKLSGNERTKVLAEFKAENPDLDFIPFSAKEKTGVNEVRARIFGK